jgi:oligoribonuclease (3'-5' exoribonuclease)
MNSVEMTHLLSVYVHHSNITCIFTLQNYFHPSRFGKTMIRNVHYRVIFYNRVEQSELRHISMQITPLCPNFLSSCFKFLQKHFPEKYSHYIIIDGHSQSKMPDMHIRSNIFPDKLGEIKPIIFFPNNKNCKEN